MMTTARIGLTGGGVRPAVEVGGVGGDPCQLADQCKDSYVYN